MMRGVMFFYLMMGVFTASLSIFAHAKSNQKIEISSDGVEHNAQDNVTTFSGNVIVLSGGMKMNAKQLYVTKEENGNRFVARGSPVELFCEGCADFIIYGSAGNKVKFDETSDYFELSGGVEMCADENCSRGKLLADFARWDRKKERVMITGKPVLTAQWLLNDNEDPIYLRSEKLTYDVKRGDVLLEGRARIERGDSQISGTRVNFNINTGSLSADAPADERVKAVFGSSDE